MSDRKKKKIIDSYDHEGKKRVNNPQVGLVSNELDPVESVKKYDHDPHIDPYLSWAGKTENVSFEVPTVSLHVHEKIDSRTIVDSIQNDKGDKSQLSLFELPEENLPIRKAIEFYSHKHNWTNRLIAGDSLLVMNSLLEKEELGGKFQTVFMDPPFGISYKSNFQPFVNKLNVADRTDEDLTAEPEQIRAFRDTWELGIHSYLSYLRDRLWLARELLNESGSCFVQIGSENVHRVGILMDEIFGTENKISTISFATTSGSTAKTLPEVSDFLLWYAKDKNKIKYHQLYEPLSRKEIIEYFSSYVGIEGPDGKTRKLSKKERISPNEELQNNERIYRRVSLVSQEPSDTGRSEPFDWDNRTFKCGKNGHWGISHKGLSRLAEIGRLEAVGGENSLSWKRYEDEVPGRRINNMWHSQMYASDKVYVVQTSPKVLERIILMTSDPGDLVFDPTCGSGVTACAAEKFGRRWVTCDTSRVAIAIAKQKLMTSYYPYYRLSHPDEGVGSGFQYESVKTVSAKILGYDEPPNETILYDRPYADSKKFRVTGPFTVEAVPAPTVKSIYEISGEEVNENADNSIANSGDTIRYDEWRDQLFNSGIKGKQGQKINFSRLEPLPGARWLHVDGEVSETNQKNEGESDSDSDSDSKSDSNRVVISFGPDFAPLDQRQVELAIDEARKLVPTPSIIAFASFQFDPEAAKDIEETQFPGTTLLKVQMSSDLLTEDLKKDTKSSEAFWLIGQPDVELVQIKEGEVKEYFKVSVRGFDYYNTVTGKVESGGSEKIAMWMLDPNYDGRSIFPRQVFFPMANDNEGWTKLCKSLKADIDFDHVSKFHSTESLPFEFGKYERAAVKIIDDRGIESIKILDMKNAKKD